MQAGSGDPSLVILLLGHPPAGREDSPVLLLTLWIWPRWPHHLTQTLRAQHPPEQTLTEAKPTGTPKAGAAAEEQQRAACMKSCCFCNRRSSLRGTPNTGISFLNVLWERVEGQRLTWPLHKEEGKAIRGLEQHLAPGGLSRDALCLWREGRCMPGGSGRKEGAAQLCPPTAHLGGVSRTLGNPLEMYSKRRQGHTSVEGGRAGGALLTILLISLSPPLKVTASIEAHSSA